MSRKAPFEKPIRYARRIVLALTVVAGVFFFTWYGSTGVPAGMDTMPESYPPGTWCLVERSPGTLVAMEDGQPTSSVVFVEVEGGGLLLARVKRIEGEQVFLHIENRDSRFAGYEEKPVARSQIRYLVLTGFVPDEKQGQGGKGAGADGEKGR